MCPFKSFLRDNSNENVILGNPIEYDDLITPKIFTFELLQGGILLK